MSELIRKRGELARRARRGRQQGCNKMRVECFSEFGWSWKMWTDPSKNPTLEIVRADLLRAVEQIDMMIRSDESERNPALPGDGRHE